jgi:polyhydroxyalkanoate synthesis regulator phasin
VKALVLETAIINRLKEMLVNKKIVKGMIETAKSSDQTHEIKNSIQLQKGRIKGTERALESILSHLETIPASVKAQSLYGRLSTLEEQKAKLEEELNKLNTSLITHTEIVEPAQYLEFLHLLLSQLDLAPHVLQTRLLKALIHKIIIHPDEIEVLMHVGKYVLDLDASPSAQHDREKNFKECSHTLTNGAPLW